MRTAEHHVFAEGDLPDLLSCLAAGFDAASAVLAGLLSEAGLPASDSVNVTVHNNIFQE